ncbi:MAG: serine/threonine-protein kinase, partial [Planctomycetota bacterium]
MPSESGATDSANGPKPPPSRTLGPYEIKEEAGRGGMGVVYRAFDTKLKRTVALKVLIAGEDASEEAIARFRREGEAVARLGHHPNIVPVYDMGSEGSRHYFAMHFVAGQALDAMIDEGEIAPKRAADITKQLAEALAHAHGNGILHRDVKPANVILGLPGKTQGVEITDPKAQISTGGSEHRNFPMLTDFGLAKDIESESRMTRSGMTLGTPQYMPPEQADGRIDEIDERSDVYSLGATLYEMLTLRPPFEGATALEVIRKVLSAEPAPPRRRNPLVERDLETICLKCLEKEPSERYATARALAADLEHHLAGEPIEAKPIGHMRRFARKAGRNKAVTALVLVMLIALLLGLTLAAERGLRKGAAWAELEEARELSSTAETLEDWQRVQTLAADSLARFDSEEARGLLALARKRSGELAEESRRREDLAKALAKALPHLRRGRDAAARAELLARVPQPNAEAVQRELEEARSSLDRAIEIHPEHAEALEQRGAVLAAFGRTDDALADLDEAIRIASSPALLSTRAEVALWKYVRLRGLPAPVLGNGLIYVVYQKPESDESREVRTSVEKDLEASGGESGLVRAMLHFADEKYVETIELLSDHLKTRPFDAEGFVYRGMALLLMAKVHDAQADFETARKLKPHLQEAAIGEARCSLIKGDRDRVEELCSVLESHPAYGAVAERLRGDAHLAGDEHGLAEEAYGRAIELDPGDDMAFLLRGVARKSLGKVAEALTDYTRAAEIDDRNWYAFLVRGLQLHRDGRREEALSDLRRVLTLRPGQSLAHFRISLDELAEGRYVEAVRHHLAFWFSRSREVEHYRWGPPEMPAMTRGMAAMKARIADQGEDRDLRLTLGVLRMHSGELREALEDVERLVKADESDPTARTLKGILLYRMGRAEEGRKDLEEAAAHPDGRALALSFLGRVLHNGCHERLAALGAYDAFLSLNPLSPAMHFNASLVDLATGNRRRAMAKLCESTYYYSYGFSHRLLAAMFLEDGGDPQAWQRLKSSCPRSPALDLALVNAYQRFGLLREALAHLGGLHLDEQRGKYHRVLLLDDMGRHEELLPLAEKLLKTGGLKGAEEHNVLQARAHAQFVLGRYEGAAETLSRIAMLGFEPRTRARGKAEVCLRLARADDNAVTDLKDLNSLWSLAFNASDFERAARVFDPILDREDFRELPRAVKSIALYGKAMALYRQGRYKEAWALLDPHSAGLKSSVHEACMLFLLHYHTGRIDMGLAFGDRLRRFKTLPAYFYEAEALCRKAKGQRHRAT